MPPLRYQLATKRLPPFETPRGVDVERERLPGPLESTVAGLGPEFDARKLSPAQQALHSAVFLRGHRQLLIEIDENLMRANLSPAEQALHLGKREEIYLKLHPQTKHGGAPGAGRGRGKVQSRQDGDTVKRFTKDTAAKTGQSARTVRRGTSRSKNLGEPVLEQIIGTSVDGQAARRAGQATQTATAGHCGPIGR